MGKNFNKKISETSARLGEVRFSYAYVFNRRQGDEDGKEGKYSVCVLIPKKDTATLDMLKEIIAAAEQKGKNSKWGGKIPAKRSNPLRDGDEEEKGEEFEGMMFFNCSSTKAPGIRVLEEGKVIEAMDEDDFYSGCWGAVTVNAFPFDSNGNKGVGLGLNNLIKTRDDERLAGGSTAEEDFGDLEEDLL